MLLKIVREGLGRAIAFIDQLTRPTPMVRTAEAQRAAELAVQPMALYQYFACPFCIKTRRAIHRLNLPIELRDAQHDPEHRGALAEGGGRVQVPCLRIDEDGGTRWLYESSDIIGYLQRHFGGDGTDGNSADRSTASGGPSPGNRSGNGGQTMSAVEAASAWVDRSLTLRLLDQGLGQRMGLGLVLSRGLVLSLGLGLGLFASAAAQADQQALHAYGCEQDGIQSFSDKPCGRGQRRVFLGYSSPRQAAEAYPSETYPTEADSTDTIAADPGLAAADAQVDGFIDRLELKRAIARSEGHISDLLKQRNAEIDQLRARMTGSAWLGQAASETGTDTQLDSQRLIAAERADEDLSVQIQTVNTRYAEDIAVEEQRLDHLRAQLAVMEGASLTND
jgi:glutaredoxin